MDQLKPTAAIDVIRFKLTPDVFKAGYGLCEAAFMRSERDSVNSAGRCAAYNRERISCAGRQLFGQRFEHANLIGGACATAGQNQGILHGARISSPDPAAATEDLAGRSLPKKIVRLAVQALLNLRIASFRRSL